MTLGELGPDAKAAVPAIHEFLEKAPEQQSTAIEALGQIGPAAKAALPRLREILKSADTGLSRTVSEAIKRIAAE